MNILKPNVKLRGDGDSEQISFLRTTPSSTPYVQMAGRASDIGLSCFYMTFPLVLLTGALLGLIYRFQVVRTNGPFDNLRIHDPDSSDSAYYVALSSTTVAFISSWMSSFAPMLVGFAVSLAGYRVAQKVLQDTKQDSRRNLFTPYQLSLMLRLVNGGMWAGLWYWLHYITSWGGQRQPQAKGLISIVSISALGALIGLAVFGADTWLHIATQTVDFIELRDVTSQGHAFNLNLLSPNCTTTNNSIIGLVQAGMNCGYDVELGLLVDATEPIRTLNNISNSLVVQNNGPDPTLEFLGISTQARDPSFDFSATTYGMRTQCTPATRECNLNSGGNMTYNCGNGSFTGAVLAPEAGADFQLGQFKEADLSGGVVLSFGVLNPYYTILAAVVVSPSNQQAKLASDPQVVAPLGALGFVLMCNTTLYDVQYDIVNNTIVHIASTPSNTSAVNIWAIIMAQSGFGISNLNTAVTIGVQFAQSLQDVADAFAAALSRVTLAAGVQGVVRVPSSQVQQRTSILVAKVPIAPLYCLVGATLIFVVLGVVLTVQAWTAPPESREVQTRLSIEGLVADRFEGLRARAGVQTMESLFEEHAGAGDVRIGIDRSEQGGYAFKVVGNDLELSQTSYYSYSNGGGQERWRNVGLNSDDTRQKMDSVSLDTDSGREGWI